MNTSTTAEEIFARQITLLGDDRQARLRDSSILVVGAGGLGCPALQYLAAAGIGRIGVADHDHVTASNLQRQVLFQLGDIGKKKAAVAVERLSGHAPFTKFHAEVKAINASNVLDLMADYDVVLDCTDNFHTKFLLHDACFLQKKILIQASVYQYEGQLHCFDFTEETGPCLRCLWPEQPQDGCTGTCAEVGVMGPLLGVMGSLQAMEALKKITGLPGAANGESIFVDLSNLSLNKRKFKAAKNCVCCVRKEILMGEDLQVTLPINLQDFHLVDVRTPEEFHHCSFIQKLSTDHEVSNVPLAQIEELMPDEQQRYLFICERGVRSLQAAQAIRNRGVLAFSLEGGASAYRVSE